MIFFHPHFHEEKPGHSPCTEPDDNLETKNIEKLTNSSTGKAALVRQTSNRFYCYSSIRKIISSLRRDKKG